MISLKEFAALCNVSTATVSKALNGHSDISEEKKKEIKRMAEKMGYRPNFYARALKTNKTYSIGVLFADESQSGLTHDFFSRVLDSFKSEAESKGYDITFVNCNKDRYQSYLEHCRYRGFDGVCIACIDFVDPDVKELLSSKIPIVAIDYVVQDHSSVIADNVKGMNELTEYIISQGHTKIAYIHGETVSAVTKGRVTSFYNTMEEHGLTVPDEYIHEAKYRDMEDSAAITERLLELKNPPTCIIYPDDFASIGGQNVLKKRGLRIPEDISIAGYDGSPLAIYAEPNLTTVKQNEKEIGKRAAQKLIDIIKKPKATLDEHIVVDNLFLPGQTVKNIRQS